MMDTLKRDTLILGIGNLLWADEGFGVRCVETLHAGYELPDNVCVMDGGTQGLYLLPYVEAARRLIVFDAIDYGLEPGTLKLVENQDVPLFMGAKKMSLHQTGFQEVLASAQLLGRLPEKILLIGVQPAELEDYGGSLRPQVKAQLPIAVDIAVGRLRGWGVVVCPRAGQPAVPLNAGSLDMNQYEANRPSEEEACRFGDARFIADGSGSA